MVSGNWQQFIPDTNPGQIIRTKRNPICWRFSAVTKTFLKSCEHWSEKYVEEMHNFYKLANLDYAELANALNWNDVFRRIRGKLGTESLKY